LSEGIAVTQLDPVQLWRRFKRNTLLYARLWLETGELPESCHFTTRERLEPWIAAVTAGSPEVREALLAVVPPIPPREPEPTRDWIMAAIGNTYSVERESDETERVAAQLASEPVEVPEKPISAGRGGVTQDPVDVLDPPAPVTHQEGVVTFPLPEGNRQCATCGRGFKPYRPTASFCSSACRQRAYRERKAA